MDGSLMDDEKARRFAELLVQKFLYDKERPWYVT
jgi:hypothetical protein